MTVARQTKQAEPSQQNVTSPCQGRTCGFSPLAFTAGLFDAIAAGVIRPAKVTRYALKDVQQAHRDLEGARTSGSVVLLP